MKYINKIVIFTLVISIILGGIYVHANADAAINKGTVRFSVKNHKIKQGHSVKINIIKRNVRGSLKVKMKSSNQKILQVKKNRVTGMNPGKATVRLSYTLNGKKKIRNIKFLVTASNKAVAVTTGTAFNPNKSHYDEDKLQKIMAGYDNPEYFDFNNYPNKVNWNEDFMGDSDRYMVNKEWQTLPAYVRGTVIYFNTKIKFCPEGADSEGADGEAIGSELIRIFHTRSLVFAHECAHIYGHFAENYTNLKAYSEYKKNPKKYGTYGSNSKREFFAESIANYVHESTNLFDETFIKLRLKEYPIRIYKRDLQTYSIYYAVISMKFEYTGTGYSDFYWKTLKEEADSYVKEFCKNRGYDVKMFSSDRGIASRYELVDEFTIE